MSIATRKFNIVKIILNKSIFDENIINNILTHYWNILDGKKKIVLNWIDINDLDWSFLSENKNAIHLLKENQDKIYWSNLSKNPNAIDLLKERIKYEKSLTKKEFRQLQNKINWFRLSSNPAIFEDEPMPII